MAEAGNELSEARAEASDLPGPSSVILRSDGSEVRSIDPSETGSRSELDDSREEISRKILRFLERDLLACDVQLSLFVGAARSYRYDSILSPFPPEYFNSATGAKDIQGIQEWILNLPPLSCLRWQLEQRCCKLTHKQLSLLLWILAGGPNKLSLRSLPKEDRCSVLSQSGHPPAPNQSLPNYVFEVSNNSTDRWTSRCNSEDVETFYAFHGSRLDNWFSILSTGLQQHRTKTALFGEGIYLSSELGVSLNFSSRGVGWERSNLGRSMSCLALAEVINHPSVKIHHEDASRGRVAGSEGGKIPENYILVQDNQMVHIRYLLVYCNDVTGKGQRHGENVQLAPGLGNRFLTWASGHRLILLLVAYGLLLLTVGLSNSVWIKRMLRKYGFQ